MLELAAGDVGYDLRFGRDQDGRGTIRGMIEAELHLCCQRCTRPYVLPVRIEIALALIEGLDEAAELPEAYDPLMLEGRLLRSSELIEDELILAVPPIPRHEHGACEPPGEPAAKKVADPEADPGASKRPNPFAALAQLKRDRSD
jgi:uncharacterized protein